MTILLVCFVSQSHSAEVGDMSSSSRGPEVGDLSSLLNGDWYVRM